MEGIKEQKHWKVEKPMERAERAGVEISRKQEYGERLARLLGNTEVFVLTVVFRAFLSLLLGMSLEESFLVCFLSSKTIFEKIGSRQGKMGKVLLLLHEPGADSTLHTVFQCVQCYF